MHKYPDVVTVNTRKLKKILFKVGLTKEESLAVIDKYDHKMIVCGHTEYGYVCVSTNQDRVNVPHTLTRRIRNNKHLRIEE